MSALYQNYLWLAGTIMSAGKITREDINRRWAYSSLNDKHDSQINERTFHNWRHGAESLLNIIIDCDKRNGNVYYISNEEAIRKDQSRQWMLDSFSVESLVKSTDLREYVLLETIPSDSQYLIPIMDAIRNRKVLSVNYKRFDAPQGHTLTMQPYCVKSFKRRWYMVGLSSDHPDEIRIYALDRIHSLQILDRSYTIPQDFNGHEYFKNYYGIFRGKKQPARIVIQVNDKEAEYLRTLPLHASQKELPHTQFEYYLAPTFDFIQELRTFGANLKIIEPQSLVEEFRKLGKDYQELYR